MAFTMDEIQEEFNDIYNCLLGEGIPVPEGIRLSKRFLCGAHTLGQCRRKHVHEDFVGWYFKYAIQMNRAFLTSDKISEKTLRSVLVHEFVHTLPDCWNHGPEFHRWGSIVGPIFDVDVTTRAKGSELEEFDEAQFERAKGVVVCLDCGTLFRYYRRTERMKKWGPEYGPGFYCRCKNSGGNPKKHRNCLVLRVNGRDAISSQWCDPSYHKKAQAWLERHVPPAALAGYEPFHWTMESIKKEYWWKTEAAVAAESIPKQPAHAPSERRPKEKKPKFEQLPLF